MSSASDSRAMVVARTSTSVTRPGFDPETGRYSIVVERRKSSRPPPNGERPTPDGDFDPATDIEWQKLWLATQRRSWTTLAVLPASLFRSSLRTARALASVGWQHLARPVEVIDATDVELGSLEIILDELARRRYAQRLTIVAVPSARTSPPALRIAAACDAALLALRLDDRIEDAEKAIEEVGAERFVGSVVVHDRDGAP